MIKRNSAKPAPYELCFFCDECKTGEEHSWYWGQLVGSMHRLQFVRDEFANIKKISDIDLALERLAYHMENYLVRIFELRERLATLFAFFAGCGVNRKIIGQLKRKKERENFIKELTVKQDVSDTYLELLLLIDDDIDLRNENTHNTLLSLRLYDGHDFYDPHDVLLDVLHQQTEVYERFKKRIRQEIRNTIQRYSDKINTITRLTMINLQNMDSGLRDSRISLFRSRIRCGNVEKEMWLQSTSKLSLPRQ
jgi:hypothetical protein